MTQDSEVISGMELSDLKIICIVGNPKCTTRKLSYVMDLLLKPFIKEVKSYTKRSNHNFSKFQQEVCDNKRNITFDLANLHKRVPHKLGIKATNHYLSN